MVYWFLLMIAMIFADQITKWLAVIYLKGEGSFMLWEGVFHLTYVENTGSAFGMLKNHRWVFMLVSTVLIVGLLTFFICFYKSISKGMRWSCSLIIAGGIGNMIDRVLVGYVVDFFDFTLIDFAVFNVADSLVCVGAGLFVLSFILDMIKEEKNKKQQPSINENAVSEGSNAESNTSEGNDKA